MTSRDHNRSHYLRRKYTPPTSQERSRDMANPQDRALVATSEQEYKRLRRDYPLRKIVLDVPRVQQELFNTRGFIDV